MLTLQPATSLEAASNAASRAGRPIAGAHGHLPNPWDAMQCTQQCGRQRENRLLAAHAKTTRQSEKHQFSLGNGFFLQ